MEKPKRSRKRKDLPVTLNSNQPIIVVKSPLVGSASNTKPLTKTPPPPPVQPVKPVSPVNLNIPKKLEVTKPIVAPVQQQPLVKKVNVQISPPSPINLPALPASPPPIKSVNMNHAIAPKAIKPIQPKQQLTIDESFKRVLSPAIIEPPLSTPHKARVQISAPSSAPPSYNTIVNHKKQQTPQQRPQLNVPNGGAILFKHTKPAMMGNTSSLQELERKRTMIRQQHQIELEKIRRKQEYIQQLERKQKEAELLKNIQQEKLYLNKLEEERRKLEHLEQLRKNQLQHHQRHQQRQPSSQFNPAKYEELKEAVKHKQLESGNGDKSKRILKYPKPIKYSADGIPLVQKSKKRVQFTLNFKELEELEELKKEIETPTDVKILDVDSSTDTKKNENDNDNDFDEIIIDTRKSKWKVDKSSKKNKENEKTKAANENNTEKVEEPVIAIKKNKVVLDDEDEDVFVNRKKVEKPKPVETTKVDNVSNEANELKYNKKMDDKLWKLPLVNSNDSKEIIVDIGIIKDTEIPKANKIKAKLLDEEIFNNPEKFKNSELKLFYGVSTSKNIKNEG